MADLPLLLKGSWWVDDDIGDFSRQRTIPYMIGDAEKEADMLADNSPVAQAALIKAPLLLFYVEADRRVPLAHGSTFRWRSCGLDR